MGTRGLVTIIYNGKKLCLYNPFDSYPFALGLDILCELIELLKEMSIEELKEKFEKIEYTDA